MTVKNQQRVHRWLRKWQRRFLLDAWKIDVTFSSEFHPLDNGRTVYLTVAPDARYMQYDVIVWMDFWSLSESDQERGLSHELCHGPLASLAEMAARAVKRKLAIANDVDDAEERIAEWVSRCMWKAHGGT